MDEAPNLTLSEFEHGYRVFQTREYRDAMYRTATFLVEHFWGQPWEMADGMRVLLLTWNQAFYRYGKYIAFAYKMQTLARHLRKHTLPNSGRTLLKLIDEYNYAKYTKGWV